MVHIFIRCCVRENFLFVLSVQGPPTMPMGTVFPTEQAYQGQVATYQVTGTPTMTLNDTNRRPPPQQQQQQQRPVQQYYVPPNSRQK